MELKKVDVLAISPSESFDRIASRHVMELPAALRFFLWRSGATSLSGSSLLSYLLFEAGYCQDLIEHGYEDAMERREEILNFFGV